MRSTYKASKEAKLELAKEILANPVYLPRSGFREHLEKVLAAKLSMADLRDLQVIIRAIQQ